MRMATHAHLLVSGDHPSPHRHRVGLAALFFGITAGPIAWIVQLVINDAIASHACFPHDRPLIAAASNGVWITALIVNLVAALLAIGGALVSARSWRASREEHPGPAEHLLDAGEGRTRFMAICGEIASWGFLLAIIFNTVNLLTVPQCSG